MGWVDDMLYIEAHAGQELASKMESLGQVPDTILSSDQRATIKFKAGARASEIDWDIVTKAFNARGGYPVPILTDNKIAETDALIKDSEHKEAALDLEQDSESAQAELARSEAAIEEKRNQQAATLRKKTYND
jgi:hypothetical protein